MEGVVLRLLRLSHSSAVRRAGVDLSSCRWVACRSRHLFWGGRCCCHSFQRPSQTSRSWTIADVDLLRHRLFHGSAGYSMFQLRVSSRTQEGSSSPLAEIEVDVNDCALQEPDHLRSSRSAKEQSGEGRADAKHKHLSREANAAKEQNAEHTAKAKFDTKGEQLYQPGKTGQERNAGPAEGGHLLDLEGGHLTLSKDAAGVQEQNVEQPGEPHYVPGLEMEQMREAHFVPGPDVELTRKAHSVPGTDVERTGEACLGTDEEKLSFEVKEGAEEQNVEDMVEVCVDANEPQRHWVKDVQEAQEENLQNGGISNPVPIRRLSPDELKKKKGVRKLAEMLFLIQKAEKKRDAALAKLKKMEDDYVEGLKKCAASIEKDPVILSEEDRKALRKKGLRQKSYLPVGRRGIFGGTIENMHLHWKRHEVVKVEFSTTPKHMMRAVAEQLARLSGGILLDIVNRNEVLVYRGKNYERPPQIRPKQMISKRQCIHEVHGQAFTRPFRNRKGLQEPKRSLGCETAGCAVTATCNVDWVNTVCTGTCKLDPADNPPDSGMPRETIATDDGATYGDTPVTGGTKGGGCAGKRVLWRQKRHDHTLVVFDDETVERWPLEAEGVTSSNESGKGDVNAAVVNKGGPRPPGKRRRPRSFPEHPGIAAGKPWEKMDVDQKTWQERMDNAQCLKLPRQQCHVSNSATSAVPRQQCHISSATVPHQQCPAAVTGSVLGMPGQLANESIAEYRQRFETLFALIAAEEQRQLAAEAMRLQAEAAATAEKERLQAEADADTQARRKEAKDLLQRHEATNIERLKFWHFEPFEEHDDATPEEQHREFMAKLVTRLVYTCNHLQSELVLEQVAPRPEAGESNSAPSARQLEQCVDHVVAMLGDISTFAAPTTISKQLDTLKTEVQQLQLPNKDGNSTTHYKMPTFQIEKFDDYTHQDLVLWWEGFTTQLRILFVAKHAYICALFLNSKGGCQIWLSHLATVHGVDVADLKDKISWEELTRLWKKRFIVDDTPALAINRLFGMTQGNTATRDWLMEWQKIAATPDLDLPFSHLRCEFYNRSCAALSLALVDRDQYATFAEIIDKAREIIKTNRAAAHEKSTWQPTYVEKVRTLPRLQHVAAAQSDNIVEDPAATQASLPTPLMDARVEDVDLHAYIARIDREFKTQRRRLDEHVEHLRTGLERLRQAKYKANRDKCEFARQELEYLGHYVSPQDIRPLADKIEAIRVWPEPTNTTDVRSFMGLVGYYQRFIIGYSRIAAPMTRLQSSKVPFVFDDDARWSFQALKTAMLMAPVLSIYDPTLPTRVTTDASGYGIGAVLEQRDGDDWHPVEYFSHKVPPINSLDDARKELLAFVMALKRWRHFLLGRRRFAWVTDNNPLTYYKTQGTESSTIGRWMYFIDQLDFTLKHLPGLSNRAADALSRRPDLCAMTDHAFAFDGRHFIRTSPRCMRSYLRITRQPASIALSTGTCSSTREARTYCVSHETVVFGLAFSGSTMTRDSPASSESTKLLHGFDNDSDGPTSLPMSLGIATLAKFADEVSPAIATPTALEKSILEQRVGDINRHIRKLQEELELEAHTLLVVPSDVKMLLHDLGVSTEAELEKKRERRQRRLNLFKSDNQQDESSENSDIPISDTTSPATGVSEGAGTTAHEHTVLPLSSSL
ncbi:hypothetical protein CBR_g10773 [Chara braunii]|uniref:CRM domain-containing protein n=1 Tax=Chara braunii TaxID=69332 RepID=A0A388KP57_CHABU|nr:hypothetical protein CBR_g10773 [Chara braunii]|eukprot:GBG71834.1 hypothetical protein CBR_g10773 [Chara braunii]